MKLWALSDLHLPSVHGKTMDIFGPAWDNHPARIERAWRDVVAADDAILLPGDLTWAMRLPEAADDFRWLASLPGRPKIVIRGNHDYWWQTKRKLAAALGADFVFLHNDAHAAPPFAIAGTRGWEFPLPDLPAEENAERLRLCEREAGRLRRSLELAGELGQSRLIVMMHFPPIYVSQEKTLFTDILDASAPEVVIYGHLHAAAIPNGFQGSRGRSRYVLVSADAVDCRPVLVAEG
jgi:uncharacterized protein